LLAFLLETVFCSQIRDKKFKDWLSLPAQSGLSFLGSYLIAPIQRIPRYKLLIQELIKHTDKGHPDAQHLGAALKFISDTARHINDSVKLQEKRKELVRHIHPTDTLTQLTHWHTENMAQ
jgi:hypothetical protein